MNTLELHHPGLYGRTRLAGSPIVEEPEVGPRIHITEVPSVEPVCFDVQLTCRLPRSLSDRFRRLDHAFVLIVENVADGTASAVRTIDPHKRFLPMDGPNYREIVGPNRPAPVRFLTRWMTIPLEFAVERAEPTPSLYVTVRLLGLTSNTLAIDLRRRQIRSYLDGAPSALAVERHGDDDDADDDDDDDDDDGSPAANDLPPVRGRSTGRLTLTMVDGPRRPRSAALLVRVKLELEGEAASQPIRWIRSLFVCAVHRISSSPMITNLMGPRVILPDEFVTKREGSREFVVFETTVDLRKLFLDTLAYGVYDIQCSTHHLRSDTVEVTCT